MQTIIDGLLVNYETMGNPKKQPILMVHGWGRNLNDWLATAKELSKTKRIILIDLPSFGGSSTPKGIFDTYSYAEFLKSFIEKLNLTNLTVIGHSFGGKVSVITASQTDLINKLFLVDISGVEKRSFITNLKIVVSKIVKPSLRFLPRKLYQQIFELSVPEDYKNAGNLKENFKKIVSQNINSEAAKITIPTIIIWGDKDPQVPVSNAKKLRSLIKNSRVRIVWNTGHDPFLEKPERFLEIVNENL